MVLVPTVLQGCHCSILEALQTSYSNSNIDDGHSSNNFNGDNRWTTVTTPSVLVVAAQMLT